MSDVNNDNVKDNAKQDWQTPGIMLSRARREKKIGTDEVIEQLGLTRRALRALENDDYDRLPGRVYIKGYIRRYCDLLEIRAAPVLASFEAIYQDDEEDDEAGLEPTPRRAPRIKLEPPRSRRKMTLGAGVVVALVVALVVVFAFAGGGVTSATQSAMAGDVAISAEAGSPATAVAGDVLAVALPAETPIADDDSAASAEEKAAPPQLELSFDGDSWVEVVDGNGDVLLVDLKRAGSTVQLEGQSPFEVMLGYAPGVTVRYNGDLVEVNSNPDTHVAKLTLGPLETH